MGGCGVAVGIAAWVWATIVKAAETAVAFMSALLGVGGASVPQATSMTAARRMEINLIFCFMGFVLLLLSFVLTIGVASALGNDRFVSNHDRPASAV